MEPPHDQRFTLLHARNCDVGKKPEGGKCACAKKCPDEQCPSPKGCATAPPPQQGPVEGVAPPPQPPVEKVSALQTWPRVGGLLGEEVAISHGCGGHRGRWRGKSIGESKSGDGRGVLH